MRSPPACTSPLSFEPATPYVVDVSSKVLDGIAAKLDATWIGCAPDDDED